MNYSKVFLPNEKENVYLETFVAEKTKKFIRRPLLIIPGGGYRFVSMDREGEPVALAFLPHGYNCFVLRYSVNGEGNFPSQLIQVAKAIKHIKDNAEEYGVDPDQLLVLGFSAGGHLAASAGVLWKLPEVYAQVDMSYGYNKPTGVMLMYPVISPKFEKHFASFQNLLGNNEPTQEQLQSVAIEEQVDTDSSPAFILHTANDRTVDVRNSLMLATVYAERGIPFELHVYPEGEHGISVANAITSGGNSRLENEAISEWVRHAAVWADNLCKNKSI